MPMITEALVCEPQVPTEPTVSYNDSDPLFAPGTLAVNVTVLVLPPTTLGGPPIFRSPMIALPGGGTPTAPIHCAVTWTLVDANFAFSKLEFEATGGIAIPSEAHPQMPDLVQVLASSRVDANHKVWLVTFGCAVPSVAEFHYDLSVSYCLGPCPDSGAQFAQASHDPTIVVTPEPIGGAPN